jgi:high-affinity Fe2+/Pb2+ permease
MQLPIFLQGDAPARLAQGAIAGALATLVIGFYWGGWVTGGSAKEMVQKSTSAAVVTALAPICVDKFERSADASAKLSELKKVSSWQQGNYVEKGGWATMPGSDTANSAVAEACARMLGELKK